MTRSAPHTTESALATMFVLTILYQAYFVWLDFRIDKPINAWLNVGGIVFMSGLLISLRLRRLRMSRAAYYTVPFVAFWQAVFLLMGLASPAATPIHHVHHARDHGADRIRVHAAALAGRADGRVLGALAAVRSRAAPWT
ncbi:hypothetical protein CTI14_38430, partial [Methylobacterium radiotolerans]